jgi:hypothetical protein
MKRLCHIASAAAMAAWLSMLPTKSDAAGAMRWTVDVKGLAATSWYIFNPDPRSYLADAHGYFDAQDSDGDGKIVMSEVLSIQPMIGAIWPSPADTWVSFAYDPAVGLSYQIDGYHYRVDFGTQMASFSDTGSTTFNWTASTVTMIGQPVPIPEPSMMVMVIAGLGVLGLVLARRGNRPGGQQF